MKQNSVSGLLDSFCNHRPFIALIERLESQYRLSVSGVGGSAALSLSISALIEKSPYLPLVVFHNPKNLENFIYDIETFIPGNALALLPDRSLSENQNYSWFLKNDVFQKIASAAAKVVISTTESIRTPFPSATTSAQGLSLNTGQVLSKDLFLSTLDDYFYNREFSVEYPGEYASRGDIVDVYAFGKPHPVRIEFFEDIVESIRFFDPGSLETISKTEAVTVYPLVSESPEEASTTIVSWLPQNTLVIMPDYDTNRDDYDKSILTDNSVSRFKTVYIHNVLAADIHFNIKTPEKRFANFKDFKNHYYSIINKHIDSYHFLFCSDSGQYTRLTSLLGKEQISMIDKPLSGGFEVPDLQIYVYSDTDVFSKRHRPRSFSFLPPDVSHTKFDPSEIEYDDLLVHLDFGIGRYQGLQKVSAFGADRECLVISYAKNDRVFVPLEKMSLVHKYRTSGESLPKISKLGSAEWDRTKMRTRRSVEELSQEIIRLYSNRHHTTGFAFSIDNEFQLTMEAEFPFEETADQVTAINEIKADMESPTPMDRLLCGDVGFGKTEVAIRAAFKAVSDSKQVVVLTPTTILSDQHYFTFKNRLDEYPVTIERLSRFVKKSRQKKTTEGLSGGSVDIIIGTHRLLSKDISFKNLGLLIIDEEHRFGVSDKDKIKKYRSKIDVLSLSATPIPRSLHFSLIGARDFSLINTPPKERLPIFTEIISFDKNIIKRAVLREIGRDGQVFFVHNEIKTIASLTNSLQEMFPNLVIRFVHGQMAETELEPIMLDFINNNIHILVTTAIIESGIDIPNANTIFINRAHNFGLSQLYQLRGRVGRLDRQAYAYLITPNPTRLTPKAIKRLQSIRRHTSLGSGYQISLEDLEIRGAGNIFGLEQSGNIHAIGYDLYIKILQESLDTLGKTDQDQPGGLLSKTDINIVFPFPAYIPENYIPAESLRLSYYQELTSSTSVDQIEIIKNRIVDIFGRPPREFENLINFINIRIFCIRAGIDKLKFEKNLCRLRFGENLSSIQPAQLVDILKKTAADIRVSYKFIPSQNLEFAIYLNKKQTVEPVKQFLYHLGLNLNLER